MSLDLEQLSAAIRERTLSFAELQPGWYNGEGETFDGERLMVLAEALCAVLQYARHRQYIYPAIDGTVRVEWLFDGTSVSGDFDLMHGTAWMQGVWLTSNADREATLVWADAAGPQRVATFVNSFAG